MLIVRSQLLVGEPLRGGRVLVAALSDTGGHLVRVRREAEGEPTRSFEAYRGVALRDAANAFTATCREESRRLGPGASSGDADVGLERWLDRLAALGELPSAGRPRPRRSIAMSPQLPVLEPAPTTGVAWQAHPTGVRVSLVAPSAGPAALALWGVDMNRPQDIATVTSRHAASPLLTGSSRIPAGSTIDGLLVESAAGDLSLLALDLLRYREEDLTRQSLAIRLALLEQLWGELGQTGGVPAGWRWAHLTSDETDFAAGDAHAWRSLAASYGAPGSWGLAEPA